MPSPSPHIGSRLQKVLRELGRQLRTRRKGLKISAVATAESVGMTRVTLNRIERGEPSVTMGAYLGVIAALGLELNLMDPRSTKRGQSLAAKLPKKILLAHYPQLKRLAWQLKGTKTISLKEALDLYERNWRHVDIKKMDSKEHDLLEALLAAFGQERLLV